jgi:predicted phosphodiesterase
VLRRPVIAATLAGGYLALVSYSRERSLSVGEIRLSVSPGHRGSLDVYVPLVDWGARFEAIRFPARLRVDLRTVDRGSLERVARGGELDVEAVRGEARDAIASYLRELILVVCVCALALGLLTAFAVRNRTGPRLRFTLAATSLTVLALGIALVVLLPPRGQIDTPQYYAYGSDIPRALDAVSAVRRSGRALDQELDDGPVLFAGDLSDRGSPLETALVARVAKIGRPFVFVTGNHDSDRSAQELANDGAMVLTQFGRLKRGGGYGDVVNEIAGGLRIAGYSDPFERRASEDYRDRFEPEPTEVQREMFADWLRQYLGKVDIVMVHEPALIENALEELRRVPPAQPLVLVVGHTHKPELTRVNDRVTVVNGGSIGGGGTGNLADDPTQVGLARLSYDLRGGFEPLAADLVGIDPGNGAATARRVRLDEPAI